MKNYYLRGFTLVELLIAIAIVGILAAVAMPTYQKYIRKAYYVEIVQAVLPFKLAVEECYQLTDDIRECYGGKNNVPRNIEDNTSGLVRSVMVSAGGVIVVTPAELHGIKSTDTYVMTPQISNHGQLRWEKSGGGVEAGYAN